MSQYLDTHARAVGPLLRELRRLPAADLTAAPEDLVQGNVIRIDGSWYGFQSFDGTLLHLTDPRSAVADFTLVHVPGTRYTFDEGSF